MNMRVGVQKAMEVKIDDLEKIKKLLSLRAWILKL